MENLFQFTMLFEKSKEMSEITTWYHKAFLPAPPLFRAWTSGAGSREAGSVQGDAIRNVSGTLGFCTANWGLFIIPANLTGGAFKISDTKETVGSPTSISPTPENNAYVEFDISRVVPTAGENRPSNITLPVILYLGNPA